jgi:hypothetical protein
MKRFAPTMKPITAATTPMKRRVRMRRTMLMIRVNMFDAPV